MANLTSLLSALVLAFCGPTFVPAQDEQRPLGVRRHTVYACFPKDVNNLDTRPVDWSAITHLGLRFGVIQADGSIRATQSAAKVRELVDTAHARGVRVDILVWGTTPADSSEYLARHQEQAVRSLLPCLIHESSNCPGVAGSAGSTTSLVWLRQREVSKK